MLAWLASWNGYHHHMAAYLVEEVLSLQSRKYSIFCVLLPFSPGLSGPLCDALFQAEDSISILEASHKVKYFITAINEEQSWFRYHHLFAEVPATPSSNVGMEKDRSMPLSASKRVVCRRGMILEAVEAAMAGRCYEQAASLLDVQGLPMAQGYPHERFLTWIKQIPADVLTTTLSWRSGRRLP